MSYDSWKTTEPDREPAPGEHRPYDDTCDCEECARDRDEPTTYLRTHRTRRIRPRP